MVRLQAGRHRILLAFCSRSCQRRHRALHALECAHLPGLVQSLAGHATTVDLFKALLCLRAALRATVGPAEAQEWRQVLELEDHWHDYQVGGGSGPLIGERSGLTVLVLVLVLAWQATRPDFVREVQSVAGEMYAWERERFQSAKISEGDLARVMLIAGVNSFGLGPGAGLFALVSSPCRPRGSERGLIELKVCGPLPLDKASIFNHSCEPHAVHTHHGDSRLALRVVRPLRGGEHVTISYLPNLLAPTFKRREELERTKHFTCRCPRCEDPTEGGRCLRAVRVCPAGDYVHLTRSPLASNGSDESQVRRWSMQAPLQQRQRCTNLLLRP
jgi:hypothetical protein